MTQINNVMNELKTLYNAVTDIFVEIGPYGFSPAKSIDIAGSKATMRIVYSAKETAPHEYLWTINFMIDSKGDWKHFWSADVYTGFRNGNRIPFGLFVYELAYPMHQCLMSRSYTSYRFDGRVDKWTKKETALWKEVFSISDEDWQRFVDTMMQYRAM